MNQLWEIVAAIIVSVGGVGAIFSAVVYFTANFIADRLQKKYDLKLNEAFEKYRADVENKKYVTKTKFDAEFELYRSLSKAYFDMVKCISVMIPQGYTTVPANEEIRRKVDEDHYTTARNAVVVAQDQLNSNAAFIPENFYDSYEAIRKLCCKQLSEFERRWNVGTFVSQEEREKLPLEAYDRTGEINNKFQKLNCELREYLDALDVIE